MPHRTRRAHFSKFHIHRIFRPMVGETAIEYIRKRKLTEAAGEPKLSSSLMNPWKLRLRPWSGFFHHPVLRRFGTGWRRTGFISPASITTIQRHREYQHQSNS